ncbi:hypothetical protein IPV09_02915 [Tessaracoccus sp. SD287]|uniref:hypothetical protein n=1 Tax=Tessaracoccus sp. SD287 TaxID=2782008 RepID=UPI001A95EE5D|nr:hypothetical protein [Tessaracoccus sp. SD287]MBO1030285.1 hypothetical protein [Tessaracoccus sp. SD287]
MTLFLVGGGPRENLSDVHDAYAASVGVRARGRRARVAHISAGTAEQVAQFVEAYTSPLLTRLPECEIVPINLLPHVPAPDGSGSVDPTEWPESLSGFDGVIVSGGHTPSYLAGLAPRRDELARLVRGDVPYIGYSAGASVTSRHALVGGWQVNGRAVGSQQWSEGLDEVSVVDGLGMITPTIGTHADVALNDGLLTGIVEAGVTRTAVGIDEDTCLVVDPVSGRSAHYGNGRIRWFSRDGDAVIVTTQYA